MEKRADDMKAEILSLVEEIQSHGPPPPMVLVLNGPWAEVMEFALSAPRRLRRTKGGMWTIDGRRYRTKRLAMDSAHERIMAPLWPLVLRNAKGPGAEAPGPS